MDDHSRKAMRQFYCRDYLWELYESMASDFDCSIDFLINEAMRHYARSKNYAPAGDEAAPEAPVSSSPPPRPANPRATMPPPPPPRGRPPAGRPTGGGPPRRPPARPPQRPQARPPGVAGPRPTGNARSASPAPVAAPEPAPGGGRPPLTLIFQGQRYSVGKDEFVIGRGSKTSDLAIKDGNVSRKHSMIVFRGGAFYLQDCGSTNGIEYNGMRIDNKKIDEGDVFHICDYELRFTYR